MNKENFSKIVIILLCVILVGMGVFGIYKTLNSVGTEEKQIVEDFEDDDVAEEESEKDQDVEVVDIATLVTYTPAGFHAFDLEVEGYVEGNVKDLNNISDSAMIKMAINQLEGITGDYLLPSSSDRSEYNFDGEVKYPGDTVYVTRYSLKDITKQIEIMFGKTKADNLTLPQEISYGDISNDYTASYYLIDNYYVKTQAQVGTLKTYSKQRLYYTISDGELIITYEITETGVDGYTNTWKTKETFKKDTNGNFIWQSIEKVE